MRRERAEKFAFTLLGALLNRRMRTRINGGVRGRGLATPSYSIDYSPNELTFSNIFLLYRLFYDNLQNITSKEKRFQLSFV